MKRMVLFVATPIALTIIALSAIYHFSPEEIGAINEPPPRQIAANPFTDTVDLFVNQVYEVGSLTVKVPFELVKNVVIRSAIKKYVNDLPLDNAVKKRVNDRVDRDDFVDEVVPFVMTLKDQYVAPETAAQLKFDTFLRNSYTAANKPLGFDHSMFQLQAPKAENGSGFQLDPNIVAQLVQLYDLLFIQSEISPLKGDMQITDRMIGQTSPIIKGLIQHFVADMDPTSELTEGLKAIIATPERLETVTISLIQAVNWMAQKNYMMFAQNAFRARDLRKWFLEELAKPGAGQIFNYMNYALNERRYAVQIVVDGLQGQLLESLSRPQANVNFLNKITFDSDKRNFKKPSGRQVNEPGDQQFDFLKNVVRSDYQDKNYLPFFKNLFSTHLNGIAESGIATTPTISVRNLPIAKTGYDVSGLYGGTGIPNFHFVDRKENRAYYFFGNDALQLERLATQAGMKTMFERLRGFTNLNCNAQYDRFAHKSYDAFLNLGLGEKVRDFGDVLCYMDLQNRMAVEKELRSLRRKVLDYSDKFKTDKKTAVRWLYRKRLKMLLEKIAELEDQGLPQYVLYYNPWPDHFAHFKGPFSDEIISPSGELNRLDYWLSKFQQVYVDAGVWQRTLFAMAGDHGLSPVFYLVNPEVEVFEHLEERGIQLTVEKISSDEGEGPKMNHPTRPPTMKNKDVVIASTAGGNYMLDFVNDQGSGWSRQPVYSELTRWKTLKGQQLDIIHEILTSLKETLDYLVVREKSSNYQQAAVRVMGYRQNRLLETVIYRKEHRIAIAGSDDLLGLRTKSQYEPHKTFSLFDSLYNKCVKQANLQDSRSWCTEGEWRELSSFTEKPDTVTQLARIYDSDRAGTVNLFPLQGIGYNSKVPGRHAGEHFHEKDAFVGFWGGSLQLKNRIKNCVNGSLAPHVYEFLTGKSPETKDGWGFEKCY